VVLTVAAPLGHELTLHAVSWTGKGALERCPPVLLLCHALPQMRRFERRRWRRRRCSQHRYADATHARGCFLMHDCGAAARRCDDPLAFSLR